MELLMEGRLAVPLPLAPGAVSVSDRSLRFVDTTSTPENPLFKDVTPIDIPLSYPFDAAIGDFDGDLRQDLFIAQNWERHATPKGHRLYLNREDASSMRRSHPESMRCRDPVRRARSSATLTTTCISTSSTTAAAA
ncbi:MAG: VCBS repeat-containing protein [Rhodospirillales bacterium]|nr:VCBS repeat-containing protein [Rhodospirillales bacterium]